MDTRHVHESDTGRYRIAIDLATAPAELQPGLAEIVAHRPETFVARGATRGVKAAGAAESADVVVTFEHDAAAGGDQEQLALSTEVSPDGRRVRVRYGQKAAAFRALGRLAGEVASGQSFTGFSERSGFEMLGIMVDASRNGVPRLDAVKKLMRHVALMGINTLMLYTEDTYEVPGQPFFGYLRGRYTQAELKELDDYAFNLGIELIPCIQTLGHLGQVLQWPAYWSYRDTNDVLLAESGKTYELLEQMITAVSGPLRSKRIHIGMDEAFGIGSGRYKQLHGEKRPFDILNVHLTRVREICHRHGLRPMIWSDMYFRLGSKTHDYYDKATVIPEDVKQAIPKDVDLVYWDYYHVDSAFYAEWMDRHRELGSEPIMAGGVWTWDRLWAALPFSFTTTAACMRACKQKGLKQAIVTLWGDDGMECDVFTALPGIQFFTELAYETDATAAEHDTPAERGTDSDHQTSVDRDAAANRGTAATDWVTGVDLEQLRRNFRGSCEAEFSDWVRASMLDAPPGVAEPATSSANPSKWLLWQDPLLAIMDPLVEGQPLREHYAKLASDLFAAAESPKESHWRDMLLFAAHLAQALSFKSELRRRLADAYAAGDRVRLHELLAHDIPALRAAVEQLWRVHRQVWLATYRPFGWEVIEGRYGGLLARLDTVAERLASYLEGRLEAIPELTVKLEPPMEVGPGRLPEVWYSHVVTPSAIK
ncbi:MAG: beta-N-acetylhexosaminidase [Limnochordaceae bacterium]|nr:beta-N-acetylhexosaminidase [Limnochordaceae bacterium]